MKLALSGLSGKGEILTSRAPSGFLRGRTPDYTSLEILPHLPQLTGEDAQANFTEISEDKGGECTRAVAESHRLYFICPGPSLRIWGSPFINMGKYQACLGPLQGPRVAPGFKCLDFNSLLLNLCLLSPFYVSYWVPLILGAGFCQVSAYQCLEWCEVKLRAFTTNKWIFTTLFAHTWNCQNCYGWEIYPFFPNVHATRKI